MVNQLQKLLRKFYLRMQPKLNVILQFINTLYLETFENQTILCYGSLSPLLHLQLIPRSVSNKTRRVKQLAVGEDHVILLMQDGGLLGVGSNQYGQLGLPINRQNQVIQRLRDIQFQGLDTIKSETIKTIVSGQYLSIVMTLNKDKQQRVLQFGKIPGSQNFQEANNYILQEVIFKPNVLNKANEIEKDIQTTKINKIYSRYDTNIAIEGNKLYLWGDNLSGTILTKPELICQFDKQILQISVGQKHGLVLTKGSLTRKNYLYGWGDGTYGELGLQFQGRNLIKPELLNYFDDLSIAQIAVGGRHSLILDEQGQMYVMGDNSADQCATTDRRVYLPQKILCDEPIQEIYCGSEHNAAVNYDEEIYSWGGTVINKGWGKQKEQAIRLEQVEDTKQRQISMIDLSYSNTIIIATSD
eukprot:403356611